MTFLRTFWKPLSLILAIAVLTLIVPEFLSFSCFAILFIILICAFSLFGSSLNAKNATSVSFWSSAAFILIFYHFSASTSVINENAFALRVNSSNSFYNMELQSWRQGHLSMVTIPDEKLLALANPYDPANREKINYVWDWSLYKGKYYIYWGVAPLLAFYLPVNLLTGQFVSDWMACFVFASLAFLFCISFVRRFWTRISGRKLDETDSILLVLGVGFCSTFGFILRRPDIYESAILAANAFFFASLYFAERGIAGIGKRKLMAYCASGLAAVLAVGSRPTYGIALLLVIFLIYSAEHMRSRSEFRKIALSFATPVLICGFALALFNYLRFDSIFEFGFHYQLTGYDQRTLGFDLTDFWNAWKAYLFNWPEIDYEFPFVHVRPIQPALGTHHSHTSDEVMGMFVAAPLLVMSFALFVPKVRKFLERNSRAALAAFALLAVYFVSTDSIFAIEERYSGDFALIMQIPVFILFLSLAKGATRTQKVLTTLCMFLIFGGITFNFFAAFTGSEQRLFRFYPEYFEMMKSLFSNGAA